MNPKESDIGAFGPFLYLEGAFASLASILPPMSKTSAAKRERAKKAANRMGRPIELPGPLGDLARAVGGRAKLAELIGVSARTITRYGDGSRQPTRPVRILLAGFALQHKIAPPFETSEAFVRPDWLTESMMEDAHHNMLVEAGDDT
jgi:hypothetical protein